MPQYRLTRKFAEHLKITRLQDPLPATALLDDWCIDGIILQRKRIAMATHAKSLLTFLLPYSLVGGGRNVPDCLPVLLEEFLFAHGLDELARQVHRTFSGTPYFCKTANRPVIGHMNDFKRCLSVMVAVQDFPETQADWDALAETINNTPVNVTRSDDQISTPQEKALALFSGQHTTQTHH